MDYFRTIGIIPARYGSTRFPGKPLAMINGKSMIQRVYEQAWKSKRLTEILLATDDERIAMHVEGFGGKAMITSPDHKNGTERCAEVINHMDNFNYDVVVNIQGDEPFLNPDKIDELIACFQDPEVQIATLATKIENRPELDDSSSVKVIIDNQENAIYFSRSTIPFIRDVKTANWVESYPFYKHIGIYAFRAETLIKIAKLVPAPLELAESLEQLRWMVNGFKIHVKLVTTKSVSIDKPDDLLKITNTA
ncbi:MAG: 3-deoxy-manno-octulosonate cytidylyltransferase [Bacteroidales bacterium]|nr:3-deoxy-manno-octulosonate cytidylyltransferase [Bacteroidales bacterium]